MTENWQMAHRTGAGFAHPPPAAIPYVCRLPKLSLRPGSVIVICGRPLQVASASRFSVNLCLGHEWPQAFAALSSGGNGDSSAELALHLSPRWSAHSVLWTARVNDRWGTEERAPLGTLPVSRLKTFHLEIHCTSSVFQILVDGIHFADLKYRVSALDCVGSLTITGDVTIETILFSRSGHGVRASSIPPVVASARMPGQRRASESSPSSGLTASGHGNGNIANWYTPNLTSAQQCARVTPMANGMTNGVGDAGMNPNHNPMWRAGQTHPSGHVNYGFDRKGSSGQPWSLAKGHSLTSQLFYAQKREREKKRRKKCCW